MAEYEILIFMSGDKLRTVEVLADGSVKSIQFQGDAFFEFDGEQAIDDFYASVADTYSVDDLADLDAEVFLVDCGAPEKEKWRLLEKLRSCASLNTVTLQKVFPMLLTKAGCCNAGQRTVAEFLGEKYAFICDDDCHFEEISAKGKKAGVTLDVKDFSFLAVFDGQAFSGGGNAAAMEEALAEKEEEKEELRQEIARLEQEKQELTARAQELQEEAEKCRKELEEKAAESTKSPGKMKMVSHRRTVIAEFGSHIDKCILNIFEHDGKIVKANQKIGGLRSHRGAGLDDRGAVFASRAGKLIWVSLGGDEVRNKQIIAVIGDEKDDAEAMLAWGEEQERARQSKGSQNGNLGATYGLLV